MLQRFDFLCYTEIVKKISIIDGIVSEKLLRFFVSSNRDEGLNTYFFPVDLEHGYQEYAEGFF